MTDQAKLPADAELERISAEVRDWPSAAVGQMIGMLRPSVESGEAGIGTRFAVDLLCDILAERKAVP